MCSGIANLCKDGIPVRYIMALLGFSGFALNFMLRVNISIAIVAMVNQTASTPQHGGNISWPNATSPCGHVMNANEMVLRKAESSYEDLGEFDWNEETQALVIGSFFWGYTITQVPGGRLAEIFGAKYIFGGSIFIAGIANLLIPLVAATNPIGIIILRIILGFAEGTTYPAMHAYLARWAPPAERSLFSSIVYSGGEAGTIMAFLLSGFIIELWGWRSVFVVSGLSSFVWTLIWMMYAYDSPDVHPSLSLREREILQANLNFPGKNGNVPIPWKSILTSLPFWAVVVCSFAGAWQHWTFVQLLPTYMKNILGFDIEKNSILSSSPFLVMWIFELIYGYLADVIRHSVNMPVGRLRKISSFICLMLPAACIAALPSVGCNTVATVALFTTAIGLSGAKYSAQFANFIDIAPNFAGTLLGIAYIFVSIPGWTSALTAGILTNGQQTFERWRIIFYTAVGVNVFGFLFYAAFASGEVQPWNEAKQENPNKPTEDTRLSDRSVSIDTVSTIA